MTRGLVNMPYEKKLKELAFSMEKRRPSQALIVLFQYLKEGYN